jgi:monovalent cation:H+ antiporter, CPA1 family
MPTAERCNFSSSSSAEAERMTTSELVLGVNAFVALLAVALLISMLSERAHIPAAALLVAAGTVAGSIWHVPPPFAFSEGLLFIFLPPLIFEAAWNVQLDVLRRTWKLVALLAFPGTLVVAFSIAGWIASLGYLPFGSALLYGAMVAATDPVAVISVFRKFPVPIAVKTIIEAEALSNDGVAVVLYTVALTLAAGGSVDWLTTTGHAVLAVAGGVAVGSALAYAAWWLLRATAAPEYEVTLTVALAYIAYLAADRLTLSGIFACASAGIVLRALQQRDGVMSAVDDADRFWNTIAYIANAFVFIATGLVIDFPRIAHEPALIVTAIAIVFASRAAIVIAVLHGWRARATAFLAGMRGALPLALALALPANIADRAEIIDAVFATVFVTLVVQGLPLEAVVRRFYAGSPDAASR